MEGSERPNDTPKAPATRLPHGGMDPPSLPDALEDELLDLLERAPDRAQRQSMIEALCSEHPGHAAALRHWFTLAQRDQTSTSTSERRAEVVSLISQPAAKLSGTAPPMGLDPVQGGVHPDQVGPYRILDVLGEGGMGVVYLAEQRESLRRRVALKVIRTGLDSRHLLRRFQAESRALAMMEHESIARVYDVGTTDDGRPYFAMEYVDGLPLTAFCDSHRLTVRQRIELFQRVCAAVQHAHDKGIIHRDLKPSNVLVRIVDGDPKPKIIDFGLVRTVEAEIAESTLLTVRGAMLGTPGYMSPEQAGADGAIDLDPRTDIFSLGAILHELLVGKIPWNTNEWRKGGLLGIRRAMQHGEIDRPSVYLQKKRDDRSQQRVAEIRRTTPRGLIRKLRGDLDLIVTKALARDRRRRYETAAELAADLRRHLGNRAIQAAPPNVGYRASRFLARWGQQVAVLVLIAAVCVVSFFATYRAEQTVETERDAASRRVQLLQQQLDEAQTAARVAERALANARSEAATLRLARDALARELGLFGQLGAGERIATLRREADSLWPRWPEKKEEMRAWLDRAEDLRAREMPALEISIAQLRATATKGSDGPVFKDLARSSLYQQLLQIQEAGEQIVYGRNSLMKDVRARLDWATHIRPETVDAFHAKWRAASERIGNDPRFNGVELTPQLGLEPLGRDPTTRLERFRHVASGNRPAEDIIGASTGIVFVLLPPTEPSLAPFLVSTHEVTVGQWLRLGGTTTDGLRSVRDQPFPIVEVSFHDAERILSYHGLALPTRGQWIYAASGRRDWSSHVLNAETTGLLWSGPDLGLITGRANIADRRGAKALGILAEDWLDDGYEGVAPVGSYGVQGRNPFGLLDVHGNVAEWCRDAPWPTRPRLRAGDALVEPARGNRRLTVGGSFADRLSAAVLDAALAMDADRGFPTVGIRAVRRLFGRN